MFSLPKPLKIIIFIFASFFIIGGFLTFVLDFMTDLYSLDRKLPKGLRTVDLVEEESTVIEVVDKVSPAVVSIVVKNVSLDFFNGPELTESGIGTGFIIEPNGLIVTNSHVVEDESGEYSIVLKDGSSYDVEKIHLDRTSDLAILEVAARDLPTVELGDSDSLRVGQTAIAIGNALGRFQNTVTVGVVSGIGREVFTSGGFGTRAAVQENAIQTDAALNPGNSGGPLLNSSGQVIGISVATTLGADNISFAIPINTLKPILEGFLKEGRIIRPYLGVSYTIISNELAAIRRLPEGAFVNAVFPDSPASAAGVKRGDIILKLDGEQINESYSVARAISKKKVGDKIEMEVDRGGELQNFIIELKEAPEEF